MLSSLKIFQKTTVKIYQGNQCAIALVKSPIFHQRTKIDLKYHFVRERIEDREFELIYGPTTAMQADVMT
jgi:hypothetical protein